MPDRDDPRLAEAQAMLIEGIADRLGVADLRRTGAELVGPCPKCGGTDRFGINVQRHVFNCRTCGGGDGIGLVRHVLGCDFRAALDWLCGERDVVLDPAEAHRRMQRAEAGKKKRACDALRYRQRATAQARDIWQAGVDPAGTAVEAYLSGRGLANLFGPWPPKCIRFHADLAFMWKDGGGEWKAIHRGPAMLAAIQGPNGKFSGVHRTWLDPQGPKGKAAIVAPDGTAQKSKKTWGAKKGGTIRLITPPGAAMMVMGEGIETTATALVAGGYDAAAYWCGVDLGNMAGRRESGKGLEFAGLPDMADAEAFRPPAWVRRLIFIQDGDSEPRLTRAQLESGLRRAMALVPGLRGQIVHAGEGRDLNDILMNPEVAA